MANRPEWQFVHFSVASYDLRLTSLYDTLGPNVVEYCVNHAEVKVRSPSCSNRALPVNYDSRR